jgi:hypothetical protein
MYNLVHIFSNLEGVLRGRQVVQHDYSRKDNLSPTAPVSRKSSHELDFVFEEAGGQYQRMVDKD